MRNPTPIRDRASEQAGAMRLIRSRLHEAELEVSRLLALSDKADPFVFNKAKQWKTELEKLGRDCEHSRDALAKAVAAAERLTPKQEELL